MAWKDKIKELTSKHLKGKPLDEKGREYPDPTPMDPPIGYKKQPSMFEHIREMIRQERLKSALEAQELEDPDEADDFDIGDDYEPSSPYEHNFDHIVDPAEFARLRESMERRERELRDTPVVPGTPPSPNSTERGGPRGAGARGSPDSEASPRAEDPRSPGL